MPFVNSSAISRIEHDAATGYLDIWFTGSGGPYRYYGVPRSVYEAFLAAWSKGTFFNMHIKDRYSARAA